MGFFSNLIVTGATFWAWKSFWEAKYRLDTEPDEMHFVPTQDGWRIALSRYYPLEFTKEHPVLLCHGIASSRLIFDAAEECSLARYLSNQGYDVWVLELRGSGHSDRAGWFHKHNYGWTVDDYLQHDVNAAIEHVLACSEIDALHWIGHSLGGILQLAYLAQGGSEQIRSATIIGASLDYSRSNSGFHDLIHMLWLASLFPSLPYRLLMQISSPFWARFPNPFERFMFSRENTDPKLARRLIASNFHSISTSNLKQLATAFKPGGLRSADKKLSYSKGLPSVTAPVLMLAGDKDRQCPPSASHLTFDALGSQHKEFRVFGKKYGEKEHYGHCDLVMGKDVLNEVFPVINDWLERFDFVPE